MATPAAHRHYTIEEYVQLEEYANLKHEYFAGQVYLTSGGSQEHALYAGNVIALLHPQLAGRPCRVLTGDARIRIRGSDHDTYPDVSVVCGQVELASEDRFAALNPCLLVEVLSPSTETYDRNKKLESYKLIPSLVEVVLVAHDARRLDLVQLAPDGTWSTTSAGPGETLQLALGCSLAVDDVYRDPLAPLMQPLRPQPSFSDADSSSSNAASAPFADSSMGTPSSAVGLGASGARVRERALREQFCLPQPGEPLRVRELPPPP